MTEAPTFTDGDVRDVRAAADIVRGAARLEGDREARRMRRLADQLRDLATRMEDERR